MSGLQDWRKAAAVDEKAVFVLVPGAWCGGWCWRFVADRLREAGHEAYPVTLTGVGERAHLLSPDITLETHALDVVNTIRYNDLRHVVLVGHSYAGVVITLVADKWPDSVERLVYLDAMLPEDGERPMDMIPAEAMAKRIRSSEEDGGSSVEVPERSGVHTPLGQWFQDHMTRHPLRPYLEPVILRASPGNGLPVTYISCIPVKLPAIQLSVARARRQPGWAIREIASGHNVYLHRPNDVARLLLECANG